RCGLPTGRARRKSRSRWRRAWSCKTTGTRVRHGWRTAGVHACSPPLYQTHFRATFTASLRRKVWTRRGLAASMHDWSVSFAEPYVLPSLLDLLRRCDLPDVGVSENLGGFIVARAGGNVIGCCGLEVYGSDALLRSLAVDPMHRSQGLATWLVGRIIARAEQLQLSAIYLLTTSAPDYFSRRGFEISPRDAAPDGVRASWEFRTGCPDTATLMRRA